MDLAVCSASDCAKGKVLKINAPTFCNSTQCTSDECCTDPGVCDSSNCQSIGYVLKVPSEVPHACVGEACTEDECCQKRRMVYWIEKTAGTIRRCRYDQCGHDDVKVVKTGLSLPEGIAFDTKREMLYWSNTDSDRIQRCNPNDCHESTEDMVTEAGEPLRLAIDAQAGKLYWTERTSFRIKRCNLIEVPCGHPEVVVQNGLDSGVPYGLAVDSADQMLYWTGSSKVMRCDVSDPQGFPCTPEDIVGPLDSLAAIVGIALDPGGGKLYWSLRNKIEECPMAPGQTEASIKPVTQNVDMVRGLALDSVSKMLYMAEGISSGTMSRIKKCSVFNDVASCADTEVLVGGCPSTGCMNMPYDVALDWSQESVLPETRKLPSWATDSASTLNRTVASRSASP